MVDGESTRTYRHSESERLATVEFRTRSHMEQLASHRSRLTLCETEIAEGRVVHAEMGKDIAALKRMFADIRSHIVWAARVIIGGVIAALLSMLVG